MNDQDEEKAVVDGTVAAAASVDSVEEDSERRNKDGSRHRSRPSIIEVMNDSLHSHFMSTMALCSSVFTMFFLMMSVFPYSGFMVMFLIKDGSVDNENAGKYAGFLSSSIMVGRAFSCTLVWQYLKFDGSVHVPTPAAWKKFHSSFSFHFSLSSFFFFPWKAYAWGKIADIYGRKFVLVVALVSSAVGSLLFGCSTSYAMALAVRFVMGLCNGTMIVSRTAISELARGDKELESKGVGILMSMVGYSMLISPSIGGILSEPLSQHPDSKFFQRFENILEPYPFFLPNLIAAVLAVLSLFFVIVSVEETLPEQKRRHWIHVFDDTASFLFNLFGSCWNGLTSGVDSCRKHNRRPTTIQTNNDDNRKSISEVSAIANSITSNEYLPNKSDSSSSEEDEWDEEMKILDSEEFIVSATLVSTSNARASFCNALHRTSIVSHLSEEEQDETKLEYIHHQQHRHNHHEKENRQLKKLPTLQSERSYNESTPLVPKTDTVKDKTIVQNTEVTEKQSQNHKRRGSIFSIMNVDSTRRFLLSYWVYAFASVSQQEAFPLFAMSHLGGLGLEETQIGLVGAFSGLLYCFGQYFVFTSAMRHLGLLRSLRYGALWANFPVILIPFSLWMDGWWQIAYLSIVSGITMISGSVFLGCSTIGANRTVSTDRRATMNGLSSLGTSIGRGAGPIFAGFLVASSMTSRIIPSEFGGWLIYIVLFLLGMCSVWTTLLIPFEEE